jgi:hypothetical protein
MYFPLDLNVFENFAGLGPKDILKLDCPSKKDNTGMT